MDMLLERLGEVKVAVIGDIMLDHYVWGDASRISPEAPVPVVDVARDTYVPGAAANVGLNIAALGGKAFLYGAVAKDDAGAQLGHLLSQAGVSLDARFCQCEAPTILKTRVMVRNQQLCRIDREDAPSEYAIEDEELLFLIEDRLKYVNAVIVSDYKKGVVTQRLLDRILKMAQARGILVAMDPKPRVDLSLQGIDLLTPNRPEALALAGMRLEKHEKFPAERVCRMIWEKYKTRYLVITMGADGMLLCEDGERLHYFPTKARAVYDVSGAGDTVISSIVTALAAGADIREAIEFANISAGIVVGKVGTATVSVEEIKEAMYAEDSVEV